MTQLSTTETDTAKRPRTWLRDWMLLPALSLLTFCFMAAGAELLSRHFYPVVQAGFQNCFETTDPTGEAAVKPDSVCWEQTAESPWKAEYRFNSRGHRAGTELNPKPPGTYRIVLIGSSFAQGLFIPKEKTFAALLPEELSMETGRKIEVYNEATGGKFRGGSYPTPASAKHFDQVLAADPDMILWVITPGDIMNAGPKANADSPTAVAPRKEAGSAASPSKASSLWSNIRASIANGTFEERLKSRWEGTRTSIVLKHLLIGSESQVQYVKSYLGNGDAADFLKTKPGPKWQMQLGYFNSELAEIAGLAKRAGVPLIAVFVPNRPQAAMISMSDRPAGYDPFKLEAEVRDSIVSHGGRFIDILPDYRSVPDPEQGYFPVDGHPNADGHAILARFLAKELTGGTIPALKASTPPNTATGDGK